ncbi:hypothetical protein TH47_09460 [Thalassospira sp. MCCC 1A02803]|nr:hypothetical protein TH47_09460 [Thalassospira sp. MCCC 1A02803]
MHDKATAAPATVSGQSIAYATGANREGALLFKP